MFARLKEAIDSRMAEEQARHRASQQPASTQSSTSRRGTPRPSSPVKRPSRPRAQSSEALQQGKGPDPAEFEPPEFVIGDDDGASKAQTSGSTAEGMANDMAGEEQPRAIRSPAKADPKDQNGQPNSSAGSEISQDVQARLRRLEFLESKYQRLLGSYRTAHARVTTIERFEAALRESTPLTTISDPSALTEYLGQLTLKGDMVMEELKRVSAQRDQFKQKVELAEKSARDAWDEVAKVREGEQRRDQSGRESGKEERVESQEDGAERRREGAESQETAIKLETGVESSAGKEQVDEGFFDYDAEASRLQSELELAQSQIATLESQNKTIRDDLAVAHESTANMVQNMESTTRDIQALKELRDRADLNLKEQYGRAEDAVSRLKAQETETREKVDRLRERLEKAEKGAEERSSASASLERRNAELHEKVSSLEKALDDAKNRATSREDPGTDKQDQLLVEKVQHLQQQLQQAQSQVDAYTDLETHNRKLMEIRQDLELQLQKADADREQASKRIETMNGLIDTMRKQLRERQDKEQQQHSDSSSSETSSGRNEMYKTQLKAVVACVEQKQLLVPELQYLLAMVASNLPVEKEASPDEQGGPGAAAAQHMKPTSATGGKKSKKKRKGGKALAESQQTEAVPEPEAANEAAAPKGLKARFEAEWDQRYAALYTQLSPEDRQARKDNALDILDLFMGGQESAGQNSKVDELQVKLQYLTEAIEGKDFEIVDLQGKVKGLDLNEETIMSMREKLKDQEEMREEIESLKDDLINVGQDCTDAKDKVKTLQEEKRKLQEELRDEIKRLENVLKEEKENEEVRNADASKAHRQLMSEVDELRTQGRILETDLALARAQQETHVKLTAEFDDMKSKARLLEVDLDAAQQLAATRFRDLTHLREALQKAQPELSSLRTEISDLKKSRDAAEARLDEARKLEERQEYLQEEINNMKSAIEEKDGEIKNLSQRVQRETAKWKQEGEKSMAWESKLRASEDERKALVAQRDRLIIDLEKMQADLAGSNERSRGLEEKLDALRREADGLREDLQLKTGQYASAESLTSSLRGQTLELATQMREVSARCESVEEELADAHRLLSERTRETQTMRRLLSEIESRTESRIEDMRERMKQAMEERDRAEDEVGNIGRKRAKETEDLRNRIREAERSLKRATEDREDLEQTQNNALRQREDLERKAALSSAELTEVKAAMNQLRDALDEGERQTRALEKERADLGKSLEELQDKLDKTQKSNRSLSEELKTLQSSLKPLHSSRANANASSRSSLESSRDATRVLSPPAGRMTPQIRAGTGRASIDAGPGLSGDKIDYVYLKNVLLQFLEQKDKKYQTQLVPVLGMLLHFDKADEQKLMAAISAR